MKQFDDFREKVRKNLNGLEHHQIVGFAWRCGMRALPFLGSEGHFDFWEKSERQNYLYSIFYALDVAAAYASADSASAAYASASSAASADSADSASAAYASAYASASSAASAYASASSAAYAASAASSAAAAAAAAYASANAASAVLKGKMGFKTIILEDLQALRKGKGYAVRSGLPIMYGDTWIKFQKALVNEDCAYWGRLYQTIFDNGLVLDPGRHTRRINLPGETRRQGAAAVGRALNEMETIGARRLNEARIIILGDKGVGKTSLARKLKNPDAPMPEDHESTPGVDTILWRLDEDINVRIWDFAGHTVTHAVHQFFLSERCVYIIVINGRHEERDRLLYWLGQMKNHGGNSSAFIIVNKRDNHRIATPPVRTLKEDYAIADDIYLLSVKNDRPKLELFRNTVADFIKNNPSWSKQEIAEHNYLVKEELENLFVPGNPEEGHEYISRSEFDRIAAKHHVENKDELLTRLHNLGVSLWYHEMEGFDTLVLNPEWLSFGVYKIINWANEAKKHELTKKDFKSVFKKVSDRYPTDQHAFLWKLMKHYELAYETTGKKELIIPHLLDEDRPEQLPDFPVDERLAIRYVLNKPLPPNTISRFIVRHNSEIEKEADEYLVWRHGVVLNDQDGTLALVREEDRQITVWVKGENKSDYLGLLRATLNNIFESYKSEKPELQYEIEIERFAPSSERIQQRPPIYLTDQKIINHSLDNKPYYDDSTKKLIDLGAVVHVYHISAENLILGGHGHRLLQDRSVHNTFNFRDCNIGIQGHLNELSQLLSEKGHEEAGGQLDSAAKALEQAETCETADDVKKKGVGKQIKTPGRGPWR